MTKSLAKAQDQLVADELGLNLSPFTLVLRRVVELDRVVRGFVFMYIKDGLIHLDFADTWNAVNGRRTKIKKFGLSKQINARLYERFYRRWYIRDGDMLYPVQTTKFADFKDTFYFLMGEHPTQPSLIIQPDNAPVLRSRRLLFHRPPHPGWGVTYKPRPEVCYA